ncbi:hypothetical protein BIW11_11759 [Tropilaelaps mercedesae]|uniref:Uncharacterized protein n=1 Tax=Tropilaelaps mercedesae TaxID=418985 RepID=A0A1V9X9Y4_9ACAR|nr:hypothetical protein BIW11_11759 [Tropilaelaps mercedesae]
MCARLCTTMKFHTTVHGENVTIDEGGKLACRRSSFCDAVVFLAKPLNVGTRYSLLLAATDESWNGALRLGLTTKDPVSLQPVPKFTFPELVGQEGFWLAALPEEFCRAQFRLTFYVSPTGELALFVNSGYKGVLLSGLPTSESLFCFIDLFGINTSARLISHAGGTLVEVLARGPDALRAYKQSCAAGCVPLRRARLFLVGPQGSGKSTLKRALLGETEPIDGAAQRQQPRQHHHHAQATASPQHIEGNDLSRRCLPYHCGNYAYGAMGHYLQVTLLSKLFLASRARAGPGFLEATSANERSNTLVFFQSAESMFDSVECVTAEEGDGASWLRLREPISSSDASRSSQEDDLAKLPENFITDEQLEEAIAQNVVKELTLCKRKRQTAQAKQGAVSRTSLRGLRLKRTEPATAQSSLSFTAGASSDKEAPGRFTTREEARITQDLPENIMKLIDGLLKSEAKQEWDSKENEKSSAKTPTFQKPVAPMKLTVNIVDLSGDRHLGLSSETFYTPNGIFVLVFDISKDLDGEDSDMSGLQPPVVLVGTHVAALHSERDKRLNMVSEKFQRIRDSLKGKLFAVHVVQMYFSLELVDQSAEEDSSIDELRSKLERIALRSGALDLDVPLKWLQFERLIGRLVQEQNAFFAGFYQLEEMARQEGLEHGQEFRSLVHFLHQQGKLFCFGCLHSFQLDSQWDGVIILRPNWFILRCIELFNISSKNALMKLSKSYLTEQVWSKLDDQTGTLISLLDALDILVESYYEPQLRRSHHEQNERCLAVFPWVALRSMAPLRFQNQCSLDTMVFFVDVGSALTESVYHRFACRLLRWTDWRECDIYKNSLVIPLDVDHTLLVRVTHNNRFIHIMVQRIQRGREDWLASSPPQPSICEKVRHLVQAELESLRQSWYARLSFQLAVACPCDGAACALHGLRPCRTCLHLLPLDDCLAKKVVYCDFRRVETEFIRDHFPYSVIHGMSGGASGANASSGGRRNSLGFAWPQSQLTLNADALWDEPEWTKEAAKLIGSDWVALAKRLGYTDRELSRFSEEPAAGLALLRDWRESNGATMYSTDVLISCLQQMEREDIARLIQSDEAPQPLVFISYQWHSQEAVLSIRQRLEAAGLPCWMDVGQLGAGNSLYGKIYEGISRCKLVLCCLTARYAASASCARELSLADVLRRPIVPVMIEPTPWPPPGPMAVILSSLVYVDLCGVGGHGGYGRDADWNSRCQDIIERANVLIHSTPLAPGPHLPGAPNRRHQITGATSGGPAPVTAQAHAVRGNSPKSHGSASDSHLQLNMNNARRDSTSTVGGTLTPPPAGALSEADERLSSASSSLGGASPTLDPSTSGVSDAHGQGEGTMQVVSGRVLRCSVCVLL